MAKRAGAETWMWIALGGAVLAFVAFQKKEQIVSLGTSALEEGKELYFRWSISDAASDYADLILQVAKDTGVDPFLIAAVGDIESNWGKSLSPRGPGGTADGGHGRGIMQIDDRSWGDWIATHDWQDPETNVRKGVDILKANLNFFSGTSAIRGYTDGTNVFITKESTASRLGVPMGTYRDPRPLSGDALTSAALAAYNTGAGNVIMAIAAGKSPDTTTKLGNYSSLALAKAATAATAFRTSVG